MSAPCRSSKARLPALVGPAPGGRRTSGRSLRRVGPRPFPLKPLPAASKTLGRQLTTPPGKHLEKRLNGPWPMAGTVLFDQPSPAAAGRRLFELDLRPHLFQSGLDLLGLFLAHAFLD